MSFRQTTVPIAILFLLLSNAVTASAAVVWHAPGWSYRAQIKVVSNSGEVDVAAVRIRHAGMVCEDGRDYRIFNAAGKPVPYQITYHDARRDTLISFRCAGLDERFYIYFGKPDAQADPMRAITKEQPGAGPPKPGPAAGGWIPKAGLVLRTMRRPKNVDNPKTIDELTQLLQQAHQPDGAAYRANISDGFNPFGDSFQFISTG